MTKATRLQVYEDVSHQACTPLRLCVKPVETTVGGPEQRREENVWSASFESRQRRERNTSTDLHQSGSMPAVFLLLRSLVVSVFSSRLAGSVAQLLRRSLTAAAGRLGTVLRYIWDRISSQESKEAILGCVLCILNMHKKVDN
ncbi:unnamed protein product [Leuciscus chuanchicus]